MEYGSQKAPEWKQNLFSSKKKLCCRYAPWFNSQNPIFSSYKESLEIFFFFSLFLERKKNDALHQDCTLVLFLPSTSSPISLPHLLFIPDSCGSGTPVIVRSSQVHLYSPMPPNLPGLTLLENSTHAWIQKGHRLSVCSGGACGDLSRSSYAS